MLHVRCIEAPNGGKGERMQGSAASGNNLAELLPHSGIPEIGKVGGHPVGLIVAGLGCEEGGDLVRHIDELFRRHGNDLNP